MPTSARSTALLVTLRRGGRLCPPADNVPHSRQGTQALPYKMLGCRAGPMCPAAHRTLVKTCHCKGAPRPWQSGASRTPPPTKFYRRMVCRGRPPGRPAQPCTGSLQKPCHCEASAHTGRGERTERCQWQKKRGERVAAVKISSVRRKSAQKFWAPQQGHPFPRLTFPAPAGS